MTEKIEKRKFILFMIVLLWFTFHRDKAEMQQKEKGEEEED